MQSLRDYTITETLSDSDRTTIHRARRIRDNELVVLKILKKEFPSPSELTKYKQEYEVTKNASAPGIIRSYDIQRDGKRLFIVFEEFGAISLDRYLGAKRLGVQEAIEIAIKIANIIGQVHAAGIIHRDIKPSNVIIKPETGEIKLIDFGSCTILSREDAAVSSLSNFEGSIPYMSPEQTGRMNRSVDYRTDLYSLGASLYEIFTGSLPFTETDALALVYSHLAKVPLPPDALRSDLPQAVSAIVMKLLEKNSEDRYQSAWGAVADLTKALELLKTGAPDQVFQLATLDIPSNFTIPQKLYGRDGEKAAIMEAFERVSRGAREVLLVAGYAGIGKTSLIGELYKPVTQHRGYFAAGKFDQFTRTVPYSAVVGALRDLVRQLLSETESSLASWRTQIRAVLGANGQVVVDVIPEVELIIGRQSALPPIGPVESQNRFNLVFQNFIGIFCKAEHPLVIFLDDLQWGDSASLKLIETIVMDEKIAHLLVISSYRDNEIGPAHPFTFMTRALEARGAQLHRLMLGPLTREDVSSICANSLYCDKVSVLPLVDLLLQKTQGNPFFLNQFLYTLHSENLLTFDKEERRWRWDLANIAAKGITDNVGDLMSHKLAELPEETQQALRLAACVGSQFDLDTLAIILERSLYETYQNLVPALQRGLVLPASQLTITGDDSLDEKPVYLAYRFLHDRVQQVAYSSMAEAKQQEVHLKIGRLLIAKLAPGDREERLFEIVDHLNSGRDQLSDEQERLKLAHLNLQAGQRAKNATAYVAARDYLRIGTTIANTWEAEHTLAFALHKELAEVDYLNGDFTSFDAVIQNLLEHARSNQERIEAYTLIIWKNTVQTKHAEVLATGRIALQLLGVELPQQEDLGGAIQREFGDVYARLGDKQIAELLNYHEMTDPDKLIAMRLLAGMQPSMYMSDQNMFAFINCKLTSLSLEYGHCPESSSGYSTFGLVVAKIKSDYIAGYDFGRLAWKLSEKYNRLAQKCKDGVHIGAFLQTWVTPIRETYPIFDEAYHAGLESGELQWAGYNLMFKTINEFCDGVNLKRLSDQIVEYQSFARSTANEVATSFLEATQLPILNLVGATSTDSEFASATTTDDAFIEKYTGQPTQLVLLEVFRAQARYLHGQFEKSLEGLERAEALIAFVPGIFCVAVQNFYHSLALAALYPSASDEQKRQYLEKIAANQERMLLWTNQNPDNFRHKFLLVNAEMARLRGEDWSALDLYEEAVAMADKNGMPQEEALANELLGRFWRARGKDDIAHSYLSKAQQGYRAWGAARKVKLLLNEFPLLATDRQRPHSSTSTVSHMRTTSLGGSDFLDLASIIKASQAISSEVVLEKILQIMMSLVLENAGARKAALVLQEDNDLTVASRATLGQDVVFTRTPLAGCEDLPLGILNFVARTIQAVVLSDATREGKFVNEPYVARVEPKSILCIPLVRRGELGGLLYLENDQVLGSFTVDRVRVLEVLASQAAISIDNAALYALLQRRNAELVTALEQANESIKLKNEFLANTSHELRTPLNAIINVPKRIKDRLITYTAVQCGACGSEFTLGKGRSIEGSCPICAESARLAEGQRCMYSRAPGELLRAIDLIQSNGQHLLNVFNDILDASKLEVGATRITMSEVSVDELTKNVINGVRVLADTRGIKLEVSNEHAISTITCDPVRMQQVLLNLVDNAVKFSNDESTVWLDTSVRGNDVIFSVRDLGIGMEERHLSKIFDSFYQIDIGNTRRYGGSGVGLTIVKRLAELQGGEVTVASKYGEGSTFSVRLPQRRAASHQAESLAVSATP